MKLERTVAVAFLLGLGFAKAKEWSNEKIVERFAQVPSKVSPDDVPEGQEKLYEQICEAKGKVELTGGEAPAPAKKDVPKEKAVAGKSAKDAKPAKDAPKEKASYSADEEDDGEAEAAPKSKRAKKPAAEKDAFGCRVGSTMAKVNAAVTKDWTDVTEVAEKAGVSLQAAKLRIYHGIQGERFEIKRTFQVRLVPTAGSEKKS